MFSILLLVTYIFFYYYPYLYHWHTLQTAIRPRDTSIAPTCTYTLQAVVRPWMTRNLFLKKSWIRLSFSQAKRINISLFATVLHILLPVVILVGNCDIEIKVASVRCHDRCSCPPIPCNTKNMTAVRSHRNKGGPIICPYLVKPLR